MHNETKPKQVRLKPFDKRTKQLIKAYGEVWNVAMRSEHVICLMGPGIMVVSQNGMHSRWMKPEHMEAVCE